MESGLSEQSIEKAAVFLIQKSDEGFEPDRFLSKISGRANQALELSKRDFSNPLDA